MERFGRTIDAAKTYVVSSTLDRVDWNAELMRGDLGKAVVQLTQASGTGLFVGGVKLPLALAELELIDAYELVAQPRRTGHGPTVFAGLSKQVDVKLVSQLEFASGAVAMRYEPKRSPARLTSTRSRAAFPSRGQWAVAWPRRTAYANVRKWANNALKLTGTLKCRGMG